MTCAPEAPGAQVLVRRNRVGADLAEAPGTIAGCRVAAERALRSETSMSLVISVSALVVAAEVQNALPFPPLVFAAIAATLFAALGFVVWSYRDVANRRSHKTRGAAGHGPDQH